MISRLSRTLIVAAVAAVATVFPVFRVSGQMPLRAPRYAITNARIVTVAGPVIEKGTVVMRDGVIEDVGAAVAAPADALIVDGTGLVVYPGLIDMANTVVVEGGGTLAGNAAPATTQTGRGRGTTVATPDNITWADQEREARTRFLHSDADASRIVEYEGDDVRRLAAAGITSALAIPPQGIIRGHSALVNLTAPPDPSETSALATYRRGVVVVRSPVAQHVVFTTGRGGGEGGGGGGGYPGALLGVIAFTRQSFLDAQWQKEARAFIERHKDAQVGGFEPALDALVPALDRKVPVAFEASEEREIVRALAFAKEFNLDPIIVGGAEAANVIEELKAAKARVIISVNFQAVGGGGGRGGAGGGGGRGGEADTPLRITRMRQNAAKVPAALEKAGIPFAFTVGGLQSPPDFVRNVARTVRDGGLAEDVALKALTVNAARIADAADRLGTIEKGKMANVILAEGNIFDGPRIRHVFVAGWPVDLEFPTQGQGRGGRGGQ
jgi:imidazolonepropionase-like amidohydrolase